VALCAVLASVAGHALVALCTWAFPVLSAQEVGTMVV